MLLYLAVQNQISIRSVLHVLFSEIINVS